MQQNRQKEIIHAAKLAIPAVTFQKYENIADITFENEGVDVSVDEDKEQETENPDEGIEEGDVVTDENLCEMNNIALKNIPLQNGQAKNLYWEMPLGR